MIVKDEEDTLARCLNCIKPFADEIVIVDTGSTDRTVEIAKTFTDKVYFFEWCDDFAAARNYSFSKANCDYIMWLDADDVITPENAQKICALKEEGGFDVAMLEYAAAFDGDTPTFKYMRERIVRRSLNLQWQGEVHEVITPCGKIINSGACIYHKKEKQSDSARNLHIYRRLLSSGKTLSPRQKFYYGRELYFNRLYSESIAVLTEYMAEDGWVENRVEACRTLYYCLKYTGRHKQAVQALAYGLTLSYPHAQDCCELALLFEEKKDVRSAIYWYQCALSSPEKVSGGGFINTYYLAYFPAIRLCVMYDGLGEYSLAYKYNEVAGKAKPNDASYIYNKQYLTTKLTER
ncbi:MAG: glycosyltransferase family 2 protein [Clostridia bacterium]|nr:glycosyltransferase family 2 protein [Clostridia bacterium]